ncbi:hypothetical protein JET76_22310 [Pseudomonas putida]|uniref:hypothetical protein n=1 Tax=Pseudomonas putida TaxID=303 RepID=UPI0018E69B4D|nr:hypothetical protein [Pseudomonas putida]MBI6944068.1 hypothetical protein [Pseudomonas putida]MBI6960148.1 hypothetical protein [Pseudomonas putida]
MNPSIDLEAAKAAFFASGGQLVVLEGFTYRPLPQRKHPDPKPRPKVKLEQSPHGTRQERAQARAEKVAEMAKTMTCREAAEILKVAPDMLWSMAKRYGFSFVQAAKGRIVVKEYDDAKDAKLAERIKAMRDIGVSRNQAILHLQIGHTTMSRIIKKFGIEFPPGKRGLQK